ncbi:MAG TPA: hypothetical protein VHA33_26190 [Candidatus Angelobacter sp.]|jgi:hypothetical protein|nr:hypothetical protein [Candidatus Angelobacter sp.]
MQSVRAQDQVTVQNLAADSSAALPSEQFAGTWLNTNTDSPGIVRVTCKVARTSLRLSFQGNGSSEPSDWGEVPAELLCAATIQGGPGMSFVASFDLGAKKAQVGGNLNQGLLVIAIYHTIQNQLTAGHSNYFTREFFHRVAES